MKKSIKYIVSGVAMIVGIFLMIFAFALTGFNYTKFIDHRWEVKTMTIPKENIQTISLEGQDEDITVTLSMDDQIHLRYSEGKNRTYQFQNEDGKISLVRKKKWLQFQLNIFEGIQKSPAIELSVPEALLNKLNLDTVTGKISIDGNVAQLLKVKTIAGKIELTGVVANRLTASATTGSIELHDCEIDNGNLDVIAGQIRGTLYGNKEEYNISTSTVAGSSNLSNQIASTNDKILNFSVITGEISIRFKQKDTN